MKYIIASDLHGSKYYLDKFIKITESENANKIIFLGDIYYHGPRNPLPIEYSPKSVAETLNQMVDKIIVLQGNCDSQVDTLVSNFDFIPDMVLSIGNKCFLLTHGHIYNSENMPKTNFDGVIYGHFHTGFIKNINGKIVANPGSLSLPKENTANSYLVVEESGITLKDLDGNIIQNQKF